MSAFVANSQDSTSASRRGPRSDEWYNVPDAPNASKRSDHVHGMRRQDPPSANNLPVPDFTGSAMGIDRGDNPLYQVPIDSNGAVSFGNWPYPGKGLYGLGYNFKPMASVVMPMLLIAGLAMLYPGLVNVAKFGRKKRSVPFSFPDEAEQAINEIHEKAATATEVCWKKFVCESQKTAMEDQLFNTLIRAFKKISDEKADNARMLDDAETCEQYECDFLPTLFNA